jgi:hypothetical protein
MSQRGTEEWRRLGDTPAQPFKSRKAGQLEADIAELLRLHQPVDVSGIWIDFRTNREPVWVGIATTRIRSRDQSLAAKAICRPPVPCDYHP